MSTYADDLLDRILAQNTADKVKASPKVSKPKGKTRPKPPTKVLRVTVKNRPSLVDTPATARYICGVYDETDKTLYIVGGLATAEKLARDLASGETPHIVRQYDGPGKESPKEVVRIISKNGATRYGAMLGAEFAGWVRVVVIKGTADFYFLLHNMSGRQIPRR